MCQHSFHLGTNKLLFRRESAVIFLVLINNNNIQSLPAGCRLLWTAIWMIGAFDHQMEQINKLCTMRFFATYDVNLAHKHHVNKCPAG